MSFWEKLFSGILTAFSYLGESLSVLMRIFGAITFICFFGFFVLIPIWHILPSSIQIVLGTILSIVILGSIILGFIKGWRNRAEKINLAKL